MTGRAWRRAQPRERESAWPDLKLHDLELSGNCYKVRLFCSLLGLKLDLAPVDFLDGAHKKSPLIEQNPFGEIPILEDGDVVLRDSQAILVYLARKYGGEAWLPTDPVSMAKVVEWLMVAENEIARGPNDARLHDKFGFERRCCCGAREGQAHFRPDGIASRQERLARG